MRITHALITVMIGFSGWQAAGAQGLFGLTPPRPGDLPVAPGRGPDRPLVSGSYFYYAGPSSVRSFTLNPYWSIPVSRVTTYYYLTPPAAAPSQPVVSMPEQRQNRAEDRQAERVPPPRPADAGAPVVARPAQSAMPSRQERDKAPPREPPPLPGAPAVPAEPKAASARHSESGKEAFKAHQYGRAERSFRRAAEEFPEDRQAHFLLAQARFALGKYAEAVAAIYAGMRLQPDWPSARYRPRVFYGTDSGDFSDQLKRLAEAVAKNPDDPFLAFLYAYQLWFDNRKDEARLLFQRAKTLTSDPSFSERFLQANPGSSVDDVVVELLPPGPRF